jgi:hypothetical protein
MAGRASYSVNSREASPSGSRRSPTFRPNTVDTFYALRCMLKSCLSLLISTRCARPLFTFFGAFRTNVEQATACMEATTLLSKKTTYCKSPTENRKSTYIMHEILQVIPGCDQTIRQQRHGQPGFHRLPFLASALFRNRWAKVSWLVRCYPTTEKDQRWCQSGNSAVTYIVNLGSLW